MANKIIPNVNPQRVDLPNIPARPAPAGRPAAPGAVATPDTGALAKLVGTNRGGVRGLFNPDLGHVSIPGLPKNLPVSEAVDRLGEYDPPPQVLQAAWNSRIEG